MMRYLILSLAIYLLSFGLIVGQPAPERTFRGDRNGYKAYHGDLDVRVGGNERESEFSPKMRLRRWGGLAEMSVGLPSVAGAKRELRDGTVLYRTDAYTAAMYFRSGREFEFEVRLPRRPSRNRWRFSLASKGLEFHKQPDLRGQEGVGQPDNVVGSYAVYYRETGDWTDVGGRNFGAGKVAHIYRPYMEDATGRRTWCDLVITTMRQGVGWLDVTCPQAALDGAVYPVVIDPTFGYASAGLSYANIGANRFSGQVGTPSSSGTVDQVACYLQQYSGNGALKALVALSSTGVLVTNGVSGSVVVDSTPGWDTFTFGSAPSVAGGTEYVVGALLDLSGTYLFFDTGGGGARYDTSNNYDSPQDIGTVSNTNAYSCYATYTAAGGAAAARRRILLMTLFWRGL